MTRREFDQKYPYFRGASLMEELVERLRIKLRIFFIRVSQPKVVFDGYSLTTSSPDTSRIVMDPNYIVRYKSRGMQFDRGFHPAHPALLISYYNIAGVRWVCRRVPVLLRIRMSLSWTFRRGTR